QAAIAEIVGGEFQWQEHRLCRRAGSLHDRSEPDAAQFDGGVSGLDVHEREPTRGDTGGDRTHGPEYSLLIGTGLVDIAGHRVERGERPRWKVSPAFVS